MSSKRNTFLEYLKDTVLPKITTGNGYNFTLGKYARGLINPENLTQTEFPAIFIASADEESDAISNTQFRSIMTVYFHCYIYADETDRTQPELDKIIEDLTKAIYEGPTVGGTDPTHGGRVAWSKRRSVGTDMGDRQPMAAAVVTFEFLYASQGTNP